MRRCKVAYVHSLSGCSSNPDFSWTWYAIEFDGDDIFFGFVDGFAKELGSFRLSELLENRGTFGLEIERDLHFTPKRLSELR